MNYKKIILLTLLLLSIRMEVVLAVEEDEFVPPTESEKPREDSFDLDGFFFEPRVIAGSMRYHYEEVYEGSDVDWRDYIPFLGTGITLGYQKWSVDFYARISEPGIDNSFNIENQIETEKTATFLRHDYGINLNYQSQLSKKILFDNEYIIYSIGYKRGISDISVNTRIVDDDYQIDSENIKYKIHGPTVGITYGSTIGDSSVWGINLALAYLLPDYSGYDNKSFTQIKDAEDAFGVTFGAKWSGAITNQLGYSLSVDAYRYDMGGSYHHLDDNSKSSFDIIETVFTAKASLSYSFDLY